MKKINLLLLAVGGALMLSLGACKDECKDVTCENGGTCDEGVCDCATNYYGESCEFHCVNGTFAGGTCGCDDGYEGTACNTESREKFIGSWTYTTTCAPGQSDPSTISTVSDNVRRVTITNVTGFNDNSAYAVVDGSSISIPSQSVVDSDGDTWQIQSTSSGTLSNNSFTITVQYTIAGGSPVTCPLVYSK